MCGARLRRPPPASESATPAPVPGPGLASDRRRRLYADRAPRSLSPRPEPGRAPRGSLRGVWIWSAAALSRVNLEGGWSGNPAGLLPGCDRELVAAGRGVQDGIAARRGAGAGADRCC